jgi:hypothetical protein
VQDASFQFLLEDNMLWFFSGVIHFCVLYLLALVYTPLARVISTCFFT